MTDSNLENLINKYFEGTIDDEQFKLLGSWLATKSEGSESYIARALLNAFQFDHPDADHTAIAGIGQDSSSPASHATA